MIYIASPYSHPDIAVRQRRFLAVCEFASEMMRRGLHVLSPIAHTHPIAEYGLPLDWAFWHEYDTELLGLCSEVIVLKLPGWKDSVGVNAEIKIAEEFNLPVKYVDP